MAPLNIAVPLACEDKRWIEETRRGNTVAFGNLVRKYQDRLYRSMVLVSGGRDEALDIVQDAFVRAMLKLDGFQQRSQFYTWLYRIAYNLAIKARRERRRELRLYAAIGWTVDLGRAAGGEPRDDAAPEQQLERDEAHREIRRALGQLGRPYRTVVVLREIDGLSYDEIGRTLRLPVGTVRSRLHRARLLLLDKFQRLQRVNGR